MSAHFQIQGAVLLILSRHEPDEQLEEEVMLFGKKAVFAAAAISGLMFASAANAANVGDCVQMAKQVVTAVDAAQPGKAKEDAVTQQHAGLSYCAFSMYAQGVARYEKALELLGQQQSRN